MHPRAFARVLVLSLVAALVTPAPLPLLAQEQEGEGGPAPRTSELEIEVLDASGKPLAGVTVAAEHVESGSPAFTADTDSGGEVKLESLPYGHYVFSFRTANGRAYVGNRALLVGPKRDEKGTFRLGPFQGRDEKLGLLPGMDVPAFSMKAEGVARLEENLGPTGWAWLRTGRGVALVVGAGTLVVAALIASAEDDDGPVNDEVSESEPN